MPFHSLVDRLLGRGRTVRQRDAESLRVVALEVLGDRTALICTGESGLTTIVVPRTPAGRQADRWQRVMRIDRIEIAVDGDDVGAAIVGASHRLPTGRSVPLSVALALVDGGHPAGSRSSASRAVCQRADE